MRIHLEQNWPIDGYNVYVISDDARHVLRVNPMRWEEAAPNEDTEPTFSLPQDILEALVQTAAKVVPVTNATNRHLEREIEISDRLLALVEDGWQA